MQETLAVISPPAVPVVALADAKLHCRVEVDADDALIAALVEAATDVAEARLKMALISRDYLWTLDAFPNRLAVPLATFSAHWLESRIYPWSQAQVMRLPKPPAAAVASIQYYDADTGAIETLDPDSYVFAPGSPGRLAPIPGATWPASQDRPGAVAVRYTAGFGPTAASVPASIVAAIKLLVGHWYLNREASGDDTLAEIPHGVAALLNSQKYGFYA